jgi:hypothetical protein
MTRTNWLRTAAALVALLTAVTLAPAAAPVPADKATSLALVPASAPIVVHVRGAEGTAERFLTMLKNSLPDVHPLVAPHIEMALKDGVEGRKLKGVAKDGPVFVVFTDMPQPGQNPPNVAVVVAVTKYEDFRDNILKQGERKDLKTDNAGYEVATLENGEALYFVNKKDYAIVSPSKDATTAMLKKQPGLDGKLSKELTAKLLGSDVGLYLGMDLFNKEYAEQIKSAKQTITALLESGAGQLGKAQQSYIEMAKKAIGPIFQAVEDSQGVLVTAEFRPTGLAIHAQSEIRAGSPTATALKDSQPVAFQDLGKLPAGEMYYSGIKLDPVLVKNLGGMLFGALAEPDSKEAKTIAQAVEELAKAKPGVRLDSAAMPLEGVQVYQYADPAKAMDAQLKLIEAMGAGTTFQSGALKEKPKIQPKAEKYKGFELTSVQLTWDFDKMMEQAGGAQQLPEEAKKQMVEMWKKLLGEKMNYWFGTDGKVVVQVIAKDWKSAEKLLDQYFTGKDTVGAVQAFADTRKELPADTTMLVLVDLVKYAGTIVEVMKPMFGQLGAQLPANFPALPEKGKPTFMGVAVTLKADRGSFDVFISAGAANEFYKSFIAPFRGN